MPLSDSYCASTARAPIPSATACAHDQLLSAWLYAREALLAERNPQGYWVGKLASSPLSTATAISALSIAERHSGMLDDRDEEASDHWNLAYRTDLSELILQGVRWLAELQNEDGGWGDTDKSSSNLATTMLVVAAMRMTGTPAKYADLEPRAEAYIRKQGGVAGLKKRYGKDKTFAAPILTNCALAGMVPWKQVPVLPFELAALPQKWFRLVRMPVVSYALPALVSIGLARYCHRRPSNPITRWLRKAVTQRCLGLVKRMQPDSGGFLEATPLTSFVVMSLAASGHADHPIVRRGVEFLLASVRSNGSWPIDTNLATWNTTLAVNALSKADQTYADQETDSEGDTQVHPQTLPWLLACQHREQHPFTDAAPGGWAWTNLSGGVPDADDTPGALLALHGYWNNAEQIGVSQQDRLRIADSVGAGIRWLLDLQNRDGGWPTFCRGWGTLPFDRSSTDLTAHTLRALYRWRETRGWWTSTSGELGTANLDSQIDQAIAKGLEFLRKQQQKDGSWLPLWFGNEHRPGETNPVYGTARVLQALAELGQADLPMASRGVAWLVGQQHIGGGWGPPVKDSPRSGKKPIEIPPCSIEETSVAVEALLPWTTKIPSTESSVQVGIDWLCQAIDAGELDRPTPIGLYFAKLWYYERLYPKSFAVSALGAAIDARDQLKTAKGVAS